jgi:hypothetical protein
VGGVLGATYFIREKSETRAIGRVEKASFLFSLTEKTIWLFLIILMRARGGQRVGYYFSCERAPSDDDKRCRPNPPLVKLT